MTKHEFVKAIAQKMESTQKNAEKALDAIIDVIVDTLAKGEEIKLVGFGSFEIKERAERLGRNPQTGEEVKIPAKKVPVFKFGKQIKDVVKGSQ